MHSKLNHFLKVLSVIKESSWEDCCVTLFDTEKAIGYLPGNTFDLGRGFEVVAKEIRKMSEQSKNGIMNSKEQLETILLSSHKMNDHVQQITAIIEEHAASLEQLNASFSMIAKTAELIQ